MNKKVRWTNMMKMVWADKAGYYVCASNKTTKMTEQKKVQKMCYGSVSFSRVELNNKICFVVNRNRY